MLWFKRSIKNALGSEKKRIGRKIDVAYIDSESIETFLDQYYNESKDVCLEIGKASSDANFTTVDMNEGADIILDIRGHITTDYHLSPDSSKLTIGRYKIIRMINFIEHVQWIYQDALFNWLNELLAPGGMIYIETPNLEYIMKIYSSNLDRLSNGDEPRFPHSEYPNMSDSNGGAANPVNDFQKWINFKLYSGCSPNDFHHCCYDSYWMARMLEDCGYYKISISSGDTLKVVAFKPGDASSEQTVVEQAVERVLR